jgi:hypothetical protein
VRVARAVKLKSVLPLNYASGFFDHGRDGIRTRNHSLSKVFVCSCRWARPPFTISLQFVIRLSRFISSRKSQERLETTELCGRVKNLSARNRIRTDGLRAFARRSTLFVSSCRWARADEASQSFYQFQSNACEFAQVEEAFRLPGVKGSNLLQRRSAVCTDLPPRSMYAPTIGREHADIFFVQPNTASGRSVRLPFWCRSTT